METIGGDLKPFYHELEGLGFITFPKSRSNYPCTVPSVASMLNMSYLDSSDLSHVSEKMRNNEVFDKFRRNGYRVTIGSDSRMIRALYGKADANLPVGKFVSVQLYSLLSGTPVKHIYERVFSNTFRQSAQISIKDLFLKLSQRKDVNGSSNNLFYTHVLCPHEPCIFSKDASNRSFNGFFQKFDTSHLLRKETHQAYCENVYGIDALVLECIKKILQQYEAETIKPIIILHSDHSILYNGRKDVQNPFITPDTVYGNLLALYIPEKWKKDTKNLTFINLYRWVFNHLFSENFQYFGENKQETF